MTTALASVDLTCLDLDAAVRSLIALGFRMDRIKPADHPREADVSGHGIRLRITVVERDSLVPAVLRLGSTDAGSTDAGSTDAGSTASRLPDSRRTGGSDWPVNWTLIHEPAPTVDLPPMVDELVIGRSTAGELGLGRAGMAYRDLIPSRHGGRYIASHIHIADAGPVPDYVHYHRVAFQLIFCARGWARLVYEGQGAPFVMNAGDAVLQPPEIRHRVLESSAGLEVVEIGSPADHDTFAEHGFDLPTPSHEPERRFGGQRFVHHRAADARHDPWRLDGFEARNTGIDAATGGLADVRVVRATEPSPTIEPSHTIEPSRIMQPDEFCFFFVLEGSTRYADDTTATELARGDSVSIPRGARFGFTPRPGLELLEVRVHREPDGQRWPDSSGQPFA